MSEVTLLSYQSQHDQYVRLHFYRTASRTASILS